MKHLLITLTFILSGALTLSGQNFYKNINVNEASQLILEHKEAGDLVIIDVRSHEEFAKEHIKGAINIDFWNRGFADSVATLDLNRIYVVYCTSGVRSGGAMNKMRKLGFKYVCNIKNGTFGWHAAKLPMEQGDKK